MSESSNLEFRTAWRRRDATIEGDAIDLWKKLNALPPNVDPQQRASELCIAAYDGGALVGVSTAVVRELPMLRCRFAFYRSIVDQTQRNLRISGGLLEHSYLLLAEWSRATPDERVMGMATVHENRPISRPVIKRPGNHLALVGYTGTGAQIRVAWFDHAVVA